MAFVLPKQRRGSMPAPIMTPGVRATPLILAVHIVPMANLENDRALICRFSSALCQPLEKMGHEGRYAARVLAIGCTELRLHFLFFLSRQMHAHPHQHRKLGEREQRRPLYQESEHHQDQTYVLRVTHIKAKRVKIAELRTTRTKGRKAELRYDRHA